MTASAGSLAVILPAAAVAAARPARRPRGMAARLGGRPVPVKKILELLVCLIHPLAVVLMWIDLISRTDLSTGAKLAWAIFGLIPLVPFLYVLTGGDLW
jgi:hypothetical protein